jgi:hypothetical protein
VKAVCAKTRHQRTLQAYLTVATIETNASGKTFINASQPFHLDNDLGCTKPSKHKRG